MQASVVILFGGLLFVGFLLAIFFRPRVASPSSRVQNNLPVIQKMIRTGFSNGGWAADRYRDMETLEQRTMDLLKFSSDWEE